MITELKLPSGDDVRDALLEGIKDLQENNQYRAAKSLKIIVRDMYILLELVEGADLNAISIRENLLFTYLKQRMVETIGRVNRHMVLLKKSTNDAACKLADLKKEIVT